MNGYLIVNGRISGTIGGKAFAVETDHPNYKKIVKLLEEEKFDKILENLDIPKHLTRISHGKVTVDGDQVLYGGQVLHHVVCEKIIEFMSQGLPFKPLVNFLENLMKNPSRRAVNELYGFLTNKGLPITPDGCFLGYKGVGSDYYDLHSHTFLNTIGSVHRVDRNTVDEDWGKECSEGLHVGNFEYADSFKGYSGRLLLVKVNPADVVAVPEMEGAQKLRTCAYEVVEEITNNGIYESAIYGELDGDGSDEYTDYNEQYDEGYDEGYYEGRYIENYQESLDYYADPANIYDVHEGFIAGFKAGVEEGLADKKAESQEVVTGGYRHNKRDACGKFCCKSKQKRDKNGRFC